MEDTQYNNNPIDFINYVNTIEELTKEYNELVDIISDLKDKNSFLIKRRLRFYKKCNGKYYKP